MTTVGDAVKAAIDTNWNVGTGGVEPVLYNSEDVGQGWPPDNDWVMILGWEYDRKRKRRNDTYISETYTIDMRVHSKNDAGGEERLDELVTEIYRIVTPTNVTGFHTVDIIYETRRASDKRTNRYIADLTVELVVKSTASAVAPGSTTSGDMTVAGDLTVNLSASILGDLIVWQDIFARNYLWVLNTGAGGAALTPYFSSNDAARVLDLTGSLEISGDLTVSGGDIIAPAALNLKVSGDTDDYIEFSTVGNNPLIKSIGGGVFTLESTAQMVLDLASYLTVDATTSINLRPSNDQDDYISLTTTAGVPKIECVGGSDLELETDTNTLSVDGIASLLMFGSANAAYVPMTVMGGQTNALFYVTYGRLINAGGTDFNVTFELPMPCNKGGLKLYLKDLKYGVYEAHATDYIDVVRIHGVTGVTRTDIDIDNTNHTSSGDKTFAGAAFPAAVIDCSGYETMYVMMHFVVTDANAFDLTNVRMECYYAA